MVKFCTFSFHVVITGDRLLGPYFTPLRLAVVVYHQFLLSSHLRLAPLSYLFRPGFSVNTLYAFYFFLIRDTCAAYLVI